MRERWIIILCCLVLVLLSGCSAPDTLEHAKHTEEIQKERPTETGGHENSSTDSQEQTETVPDDADTQENNSEDNNDIDVDLTVLSSVMVYSEVYNMMIGAEDYKGKTVRMNGIFAYYKDESTGREYFACIIQDATACCAQGMEFELSGDYTYPDDYPAVGDEVAVTGTFDTYNEERVQYCILRNARLER